MSCKSFSIFSCGGHFVQRSGTNYTNFGRGSPKKRFREIILKSGHWPRRRYFFLFLALVAILFNVAEPF